MTLWGDVCEAQNYQVGQVVALKACRVSDYNGKSLNASSSQQDIALNLRHPRAMELQRWSQGTPEREMKSAMRSLTTATEAGGRDQVMTVNELEQFCQADESVQSGKAFYCSLFVELEYVFVPDSPDRRAMYYLACPDCKKKVIDDGRGYQCEACNKCHSEAKPTYNFSFRVRDYYGSTILNCLGEAGDSILGLPANQIYEMREDYEAMKALNLSLQNTPLRITVRARTDTSGYSQEEDGSLRVRLGAIRAARLENYQAAN